MTRIWRVSLLGILWTCQANALVTRTTQLQVRGMGNLISPVPIPTVRLDASASSEVTTRQKKKMSKKQKVKYEEFQWLNWVYNQWRETTPGELSAEVVKQMAPAISTWGRRRDLPSAERGEELLDRLIAEHMAGNEEAELTVTLFNAAMDGYGKIGNPEGVQRILRKMESTREIHSLLDHLRPDVFSMSTLATAWAKSRSPEAAQKAEAILNYMDSQNLVPNLITYNAVLHALAVGKQFDRALRAEDLVKRMKYLHETGRDCKPDVYSYQCLILAWANTNCPGSPQKAEQILRFLDKQSEEGNKGLAPNVYCFTTTIHAWARSSEPGRARNAYDLLQHMRKRYLEKFEKKLKPNVKAFTSVLNACARPVDEAEWDEAYQIAELTMAELTLGTYDLPNFLSYAAFLSVCASTLSDDDKRDAVVRRTFHECVNAGQVGHIVLEKLKVAASPSLYHELVGEHLDENGECSLPPSWTAYISGERNANHADTALRKDRPENIPASSIIRLKKAAKKFGGKQGSYSSGRAPRRLESEGISWSKSSGF